MEAAASSRRAGDKAPTHVAIIMDGNGRWATARGLPRIAGHQHGSDAVRVAVESCRDLGVRYLTLYAFSSENWKRPPAEVDDLMGLLRVYLRRELNELHRSGVRIRFIGVRAQLADDIVSLLGEAESVTAANGSLTLTIALNYGSQDEIVRAARAIAADVSSGAMSLDDITKDEFERYLETFGMPDPDLVIRTSGEQRLSNFLLWQSAYAELVFVNANWPDFSREILERAISEYQRRERRYGGTTDA